jgi:hypothetical protein
VEYFLLVGVYNKDEEELDNKRLIYINSLVELNSLPGGLYSLEIIFRIYDPGLVPVVGVLEYTTSKGYLVYK